MLGLDIMITSNKKNLLEGLAQQGNIPTDDIPAKLTENEYIIPADVVIALGHGDKDEGIRFLDTMVKNIRDKTQNALSKMQG